MDLGIPWFTHIGDGIEVDFDKILIRGDSTGESPNLEEGGRRVDKCVLCGHLEMQSGLSQGTMVKAMIAAYPPIDLKIPFLTQPYEKIMADFSVFPAGTIPRHIASLNE